VGFVLAFFSAGGLTAAPGWVTFVSVYISERPDGRAMVQTLLCRANWRNGFRADVAAAATVVVHISAAAC